jgi:hypothetical protein
MALASALLTETEGEGEGVGLLSAAVNNLAVAALYAGEAHKVRWAGGGLTQEEEEEEEEGGATRPAPPRTHAHPHTHTHTTKPTTPGGKHPRVVHQGGPAPAHDGRDSGQSSLPLRTAGRQVRWRPWHLFFRLVVYTVSRVFCTYVSV